MNDPDHKAGGAEARLARLRPTAVPPDLMVRLRAARPAAAAQPRTGTRAGWRLAAAAAACALLAGLWTLRRACPQPVPRVAEADALPEAGADVTVEPSRDLFVGARLAGVWRAPGGQVYRVVRCLAVNQTVMRSPGRGTQVELLEPRQHVLLVAMKSQ